MKLTPRERRVLDAVVDTLVPSLDPEPGAPDAYWRRTGRDVGVPDALEEVVTTRLHPDDSRQLRLFLRLLHSRAGMLLLAGRPRPFPDLAPATRERVLQRFSTSNVAEKRQAFQALKKLAGFLHFAVVDEATGENPNWRDVGYHAPMVADAQPRPADPVTLPDLDARALDALGPVDAVVVGSGAGGGVVAARLARAGHRVLVVDAGPNVDARTVPTREADGNDRLYDAHGLLATRDGSVQLLAGRGAGGGTTVNWTTSLAPPAWLCEEWESKGLDGVTGPEFQASVDRVTARLEVGTQESTVNGPNDVLRRGARALGWKEGEDWSILPRNARGCDARCDTCTFGCPFEAKRDARVTWLADARDAGAAFAFDARVTRILHDGGRASGVVVVKDGHEVHVRARAVVLAAGAVRSPALLLASGVSARGIGRLFIHPTTSVIGRFPDPVRMWAGPMQTIVIDRFRDLDGKNHGFILESAPGHPGLSGVAVPWTGARAWRRDLADLAHSAGLIAIVRDRDPGRVGVDAHGNPRVDYRPSARDARNLVRGMRELARVERAAGATRIATLHARGVRVGADPNSGAIGDRAFDAFLRAIDREGVRPHSVGLFSAHQMGSVALGRDGEAPAAPTGELRDVEGVWIADGSAFPSPSGVNPMISIMSLADRTSGFILRSLGP